MKPIFLAIALQFFLQVCGVVPIVCYAVDVFKSAGTEGVHENVSTIVLGLVNLVIKAKLRKYKYFRFGNFSKFLDCHNYRVFLRG